MKQITYKDIDALIDLQIRFPETQKLPEANGKTIIIYWTGGLDSTFLVYYYLMHGYTVKCQWVEIKNNDAKNLAEIKARKEIKEKLKAIFMGCSFYNRFHFMNTPIMSVGFMGNSLAELPQALIWIFATTFYTEKHDIVMGYCNGDDALGWLNQINTFIDCMNENMLKSPITVHFPLVGMKKSWFHKAMPKSLLDLTHSCEYVNGSEEECSCGPCRRRRFELKG